MSLNYLYDFMIHYNTYKNIDLTNQGIYQIKTKLYTTFNGKSYYALPYYFTESKALENMYQTDEQQIKAHCVINPSISENNYEYITKSFIIRYADEEVELDEFCYFRLEIPSNVNLKEIVIYCQFYLGFSDALNSGKDKKNGGFPFKEIQFKHSQNVIVTIINEGISSYFVESYSPIVYMDNYSSLLNVSIHRILSDFKMRISNIMPFAIEKIDNENEKNNKNSDNKSMNNFISNIWSNIFFI